MSYQKCKFGNKRLSRINAYLELTPSLKLPKLNKRLGVYSKIYGNQESSDVDISLEATRSGFRICCFTSEFIVSGKRSKSSFRQFLSRDLRCY